MKFQLPSNRTIIIAHIFLILVNLIYGANYTIAKAIMPEYISPNAFIFLRVLPTMILYNLVVLIFIPEKIELKDNLRIIACGFFGVACNQILFFKGISITSSIHGSLLMITSPIFTYLMYSAITKSKPTLKKLLGITLGTIGASILIFLTAKTDKDASVLGDLFVMFNAISYSIYLVFIKKMMDKYNPLAVIARVFLFGSIFVFIYCLPEFNAIEWSALPTFSYFNILYVVLVATALVYFFNLSAMRTLNPTIVSSYIYFQPLFAIIIATIFADERISIPVIIGGIFIIFGIWMVTKK